MAAIAVRICAQHGATLASRDVALVLDAPTFAAPVAAATTSVERMMSRLLAAVSAVAAPGETVSAIVGTKAGSTAFSLTRPLALAARDEPALLDPGYGPDGDWPDAPLLGLGFTLRLVARLATKAGGSLTILPDSFALHLPAPDMRAEVQPA